MYGLPLPVQTAWISWFLVDGWVQQCFQHAKQNLIFRVHKNLDLNNIRRCRLKCWGCTCEGYHWCQTWNLASEHRLLPVAVGDIRWSEDFLNMLHYQLCIVLQPNHLFVCTSRRSLELVPRESSIIRLSTASRSRVVSSRNVSITGLNICSHYWGQGAPLQKSFIWFGQHLSLNSLATHVLMIPTEMQLMCAQSPLYAPNPNPILRL